MLTERQLREVRPGDKVHRATWRPHPCTEFEVTGSREVEGRIFVFATSGPTRRQNPVITNVNASGFHLAAVCPRVKAVAS